MKRILMTLMVLVMLTPSLACANLLCCVTQKQEAPAQDMPCHKQEKQKSDVMFMKDCAKIDLQAATDVTFVKKQISQPHDLFVQADDVLRSPVNDVAAVGIRGPPRDIVLASSSPPVYLATLRLRI